MFNMTMTGYPACLLDSPCSVVPTLHPYREHEVHMIPFFLLQCLDEEAFSISG